MKRSEDHAQELLCFWFIIFLIEVIHDLWFNALRDVWVVLLYSQYGWVPQCPAMRGWDLVLRSLERTWANPADHGLPRSPSCGTLSSRSSSGLLSAPSFFSNCRRRCWPLFYRPPSHGQSCCPSLHSVGWQRKKIH